MIFFCFLRFKNFYVLYMHTYLYLNPRTLLPFRLAQWAAFLHSWDIVVPSHIFVRFMLRTLLTYYCYYYYYETFCSALKHVPKTMSTIKVLRLVRDHPMTIVWTLLAILNIEICQNISSYCNINIIGCPSSIFGLFVRVFTRCCA